MSAFKEKMLAETRIEGLKVWREALLTDLDKVNAELRQAEQDLAEAEQDIELEAQNDRYEEPDFYCKMGKRGDTDG